MITRMGSPGTAAEARTQFETRFAEIAVCIMALVLLAASARLGLVQALLTNPASHLATPVYGFSVCAAHPSRYEVTFSVLVGF